MLSKGKDFNNRPVSTVLKKSVKNVKLQMIKDVDEDNASDTGNMLNELASDGSSAKEEFKRNEEDTKSEEENAIGVI